MWVVQVSSFRSVSFTAGESRDLLLGASDGPWLLIIMSIFFFFPTPPIVSSHDQRPDTERIFSNASN